jgi:hypothetical protein
MPDFRFSGRDIEATVFSCIMLCSLLEQCVLIGATCYPPPMFTLKDNSILKMEAKFFSEILVPIYRHQTPEGSNFPFRKVRVV